jgi:hypothetical protein
MQRANRSSLMSRLKTWFAFSAGRGAAALWKREHYIYDKELFVTTKYSMHAAFIYPAAEGGLLRRVTLCGSAVLTICGCVQKNEYARRSFRHTFMSNAAGRMEQNVAARIEPCKPLNREKDMREKRIFARTSVFAGLFAGDAAQS